MKYDKSVYRSLTMITQFGINMLVPIFLCTIAGVFIGKKYAVEWIVIPLFIMGALAGFRNVYIMAQKIYSSESPSRGKGTRRAQSVITGAPVGNARDNGRAGHREIPDAPVCGSGRDRHIERDSNYVEKD